MKLVERIANALGWYQYDLLLHHSDGVGAMARKGWRLLSIFEPVDLHVEHATHTARKRVWIHHTPGVLGKAQWIGEEAQRDRFIEYCEQIVEGESRRVQP